MDNQSPCLLIAFSSSKVLQTRTLPIKWTVKQQEPWNQQTFSDWFKIWGHFIKAANITGRTTSRKAGWIDIPNCKTCTKTSILGSIHSFISRIKATLISENLWLLIKNELRKTGLDFPFSKDNFTSMKEDMVVPTFKLR